MTVPATQKPAGSDVSRRSFFRLLGTAAGAGAAVTLGVTEFGAPTAAAANPHDVFGMLAAAQSKVGSPYVFGAEGPNAFDCSGLVNWSWRQVGIFVPRTADAQFRAARPVNPNSFAPGDSVFFINSAGVAKHTLVHAGGGMYYQASDLYSASNSVEFCPMPAYGGRIAFGRLV